jgi:hypothetical protein
MLLDNFFSPRNIIIYSIVFFLITVSTLVVLLNPFIYFEVIVFNAITFFILGISFRKFSFFSASYIIILFCLLHEWGSIDVQINKSKYYHSFQPLMKNECFAGYNLRTDEIDRNVHCASLNMNKDDSTSLLIKLRNDKQTRHLKKLGCNSIEISDNFLQLWFIDFVITIEKSIDNSISFELSHLD